jgi:hypothetical protein
MKKIAIAFSAAALLFSATTFAAGNNETKVSLKAKSSFQNDFYNAANASWKKKGGYYFVSFDVNNVQTEAAYTEEGELLGTSREIATSELPEPVAQSIAQQYKGYQVARHVTEINFDSQVNYYISVANDSETLRLKCSSAGEISIDRKTKNP